MTGLREDRLENRLQDAAAGQGEFQRRDVLPHFRREGCKRRSDDDQALTAAAVTGEIFQLRQQGVVVFRQIPMEIFHHPDSVDVRVLAPDGGQNIARERGVVVDDVL
jgi:hypothetical protein